MGLIQMQHWTQMLINEQITPAELPQLCFNFLFLVIRPLVSANNFVTDCGPLVSK